MSESTEEKKQFKGPLAWMASNTVAANLLMLIILVGGALRIPTVKQEVFPEVQLDTVTVSVPYPGASPAEVEQGIVLSVEEAVRGVDGVKEVTALANEGSGRVTAELLSGADKDQAFNDIKSAVDRITSFPQDAERPVVSLSTNRRQVISVILYGDLDEQTLRGLSEQVRSDLLANKEITVAEVTGLPAPEISIEVPRENLRAYGLSIPQISRVVSSASVELPGGGVKTPSGEVLVRTTERRDEGEEFRDLAVITRPDGTRVTLGDIATIRDGFAETDQEAYFNGKRAVRVDVYRIGNQTPIEIAEVVNEYVNERRESLSENVSIAVWNDQSLIYRDRISLLVKNAALGLLLVLLILGLFLDIRLAFWVTIGIPVTFLGAFLFMPGLGVSINMISLFAFILALGIVVDDAIVAGEAIYNARAAGKSNLEAAVEGVREVAVPVVFAVLTTVFAFTPLLLVPGTSGEFFKQIPLIVIPILLLSLVESLLILPAHLAHGGKHVGGVLGAVRRAQQKFSNKFEAFVSNVYAPFADRMLRRRYITLALSFGLLMITFGVVGSGALKFTFLPKIESDQITSTLELPFGTSVDETRALVQNIQGAADSLLEQNGGRESVSKGVYVEVGKAGGGGGGPNAGSASSGSHLATIQVSLVPAPERSFTAAEFTRMWRERVGDVAGVESLRFQYSIGPGGIPVQIELSHPNDDILKEAAANLAGSLREYDGVFDVDDGYRRGKEQLDLELKPAARALGINEVDLAQQVRGAFFGSEAVRQQRGRDELRVYVRLPREQRESEYDIENLMIITPQGGEIPLGQAAYIRRGRSYTEIERLDGQRVVKVTADVDANVTNENQVIANLERDALPKLVSRYPGLTYTKGGQSQDQAESLRSLGINTIFAMMAIFALMAVAFRSYIQPIIVMFAIPFGLVGAFGGHMLMGFDLSLISIMGIVALSGVVVNDSLVLVVAINEFRAKGMTALEAVREGGVRRFRPILLTSLTTFFGLFPMILETSVQARFLIPMALSLGFGILFVTAIALIIVPALYMVVEDVKGLFGQKDDPDPV